MSEVSNEFVAAPIPTATKRGRPALHNPFNDLFPTPEGECYQRSTVGTADTPEVKRLTRQARQAAKEKGLTAHVRADFDPSQELTLFSAWTSEKTPATT